MISEPLKEEAVFKAACKIRSSRDRADYLQETCKGNDLLHQRMISLLRIFDEDKNFLEPPVSAEYQNFDFTSVEPSGTMFGPYKLLEPIGEGGMGTVFLAQQSEPVRRQVALKLIKKGMDTRQVIARFEAEEQALALMDHPNIAKVFDAGATESGRPYFVMELVNGVPIHRFCDEHRLSTKQRLELFIQVCRGVQHAHQKGIIHRDLKPSNILVAMYDDQPVPKVIDFGVAKATGRRLTEKTAVTGSDQVIGTLEYMSPEQTQFNQADVDTRSDIYSLGAILYEVLTGTPPFEKKRMKTAALDEAMQMIREQEPQKPSTRISTLSAEASSIIAERRQVDSRKLGKCLTGELDWIVMKALEKGRDRRYQSVSAFVADLERYLNDRPVLAGPPAAGFRFRKFARRHKKSLAAAIFGLVGLGIGLAFALAAFQREVAQRRVAEENFKLALETLENAYAYVGHLDREPELKAWQRDLLNATFASCERISQRLDKQPEYRSQLLQVQVTAGRIHHRLDRLTPANESFQRAIDLGQSLIAENRATDGDRVQLAFALDGLATVEQDLGESDGLLQLKEAQRLWRAELNRQPDSPVALVRSATNTRMIGRAQRSNGKFKQARETFKNAIDACKAWLGQFGDDTRVLRTKAHLDIEFCYCLRSLGHLEQANELAEQIYERSQPFEDEIDLRAEAADLLAQVNYDRARDLPRAESLFEEAARLRQQQIAEYPNNLKSRALYGRAMTSLARLQRRLGKREDFTTSSNKAVRNFVTVTDRQPDNVRFLSLLADFYSSQGMAQMGSAMYPDAQTSFSKEVELRGSINSLTTIPASERLKMADALNLLGSSLVSVLPKNPSDSSQARLAEAHLREALQIVTELKKDHDDTVDIGRLTGRIYTNLARSLVNQKRFDEAEEAIGRAIAIASEDSTADAPSRNRHAQTLNNLAYIFLFKAFEDDDPEPDQLAAADKAERFAREAIELQETAIADAISDFERSQFERDLARHYYVLGGARIEKQEFAGGLEAYEKSVEHNPRQTKPISYLASLYLDGVPIEFRNPDRAAELARLALRNSRDDRLAEEVLQLYYLKTEQYEEARKLSAEIIERLPGNKEAQAVLGMAHYRLGEYDRSNELLQTCYAVSADVGLYLVMAVARSEAEIPGAAITKDDVGEFYRYTLEEAKESGDAVELSALIEEARKVLAETGLAKGK